MESKLLKRELEYISNIADPGKVKRKGKEEYIKIGKTNVVENIRSIGWFIVG